jgi:hypothetical protein
MTLAAASGHVPIDLPNSQCAYVPGGPFDTSRFKISYASVSLISIADQSASVIAPSRASLWSDVLSASLPPVEFGPSHHFDVKRHRRRAG